MALLIAASPSRAVRYEGPPIYVILLCDMDYYAIIAPVWEHGADSPGLCAVALGTSLLASTTYRVETHEQQT
jgi:hypothetical protein